MNLLGIDIGTSGCKAAVFDATGTLLASDYREYDIIRTIPGQAELNSVEVWEKICQVISSCTSQIDGIKALSVTSMGEAMVPLDRQGAICGNSVLGSDTRGRKYLELLTTAITADEIYHITGQPAGFGYALPNLCRIKNEEPELYKRTFKFLSWADFATYMLTGEIQMNYSLASRTLLFDRKACRWSQRIADTMGFDLEKLPPLLPSGTPVGQISPAMSRKLGLPPDTQVISGSHDQCAAAIGTGISEAGTAMLGLGTYACMVLTHKQSGTDSPLARLRLNIEPHVIPGQYVSFIYHGSGGALIKWLRDEMFRDLQGDNAYTRMLAELGSEKEPPVLLPYFAETGPLDYASGGRGVIAGLSFAHSRADILRAALEGIIFYFKDALEQLRDNGTEVRKIHVSGGGSESAEWRQIIADILGVPVVKTQVRECGALGAAIIAGVGTGCYNSYCNAIGSLVRIENKYQTRTDNKKHYSDMFKQYSSLKKTLQKIECI